MTPEQMADAIETQAHNAWDLWLEEADAALAIIANPSDEMVERCAKALALEDHGVHPDDWANDEYIIEIGRENYRESARACLQAVGCE